MSDDKLCPREADVLRASEAGAWSNDLEAHVAACETCSEVRAVAAVLREVVSRESVDDLPAASDLWWRARWDAERQARQRAMRPLDTLERIEPLVALVAAVTLLVLGGDTAVARVLSWVSGDGGGQALHVLVPSALMPLLLVGAGLGVLVLLAGIGAVMASD
jgi:hypothetical protein